MSFSVEQRRAPRVRLTARVATIRGVPVAMARTRDISTEGVFVEVRLSDPRWSVSVGDVLHLKFALPDSSPIESNVVVARIERDASNLVHGIGFQFKGLGEDERASIADYVEAFDDS
jgi:hypothetical protein